jgi:phosphoribosylaminoimidazole-succinocarboxamide synthase
MTGYQAKSLSTNVLFDIFKNIIKSEGPKDIQFIMQRLLSAVDVYKKDCDVMLVYFDSKYELSYDNKRSIIEADVIKDDKSVFFDSKP